VGSLITRQTDDGPCCELFNGPFVHVAWSEMYEFLDATQTSHCP